MANFENITIEKGMYQQKGKTLTDVLETLDPSENYKGTALSNLDAFSRQLKRFDIKVNAAAVTAWKNSSNPRTRRHFSQNMSAVR